ncbi:MAG: DUF4886 domain-containing protein [Rikenellaceae bacterium]|nr:DUF4886 domain-containing protein [Rikenellaceae bacterium]
MKRTFLLIIVAFAFSFGVSARDIKVLAIGNSFSVDVVEQNLHELAKAEGTTLVIGNLYIGGCGLQKHLSNLRKEKKAYSYRKVDKHGEKTTTPRVSIQQALADEKWDYVMVQQVSGFGGVYASFGRYLPEMMTILRDLTPYKPKFIIMQTWAYQSDSDHQSFSIYNYDQMTMYKALVESYNKVFHDKQYGFHAIVPNGTAIQNGRMVFGDKLTRDGYHLDKRVGRYIGACTMCEVVLGKSVVGNKYRPSNISEEEALLAQKAAHAAVLKPTEITNIE